MRGWTTTKVFRIDGILVVASEIEEAIKMYKTYLDDSYAEIRNVELVYGDACCVNSGAIIRENK